MAVEKIELGKVHRFSNILLDYLDRKDNSLETFFGQYPSLENFSEQIRSKSFSGENRSLLADSLIEQYSGIELEETVKNNISLLKEENTYTITTGHQLSIFTGPLFFHYKIITVINLCRKLSEKYPEYNFVPVFWMATEDHDFEEISSVNLDGSKIKWSTDQSGPVGRLDPSSLKEVIEKVPGDTKLFSESYLNSATLTEAVRKQVNAIYGKEGLIIIDGDDKTLKGRISNLIVEDCCNNNVNRLSETASRGLEELGYKQQVFPREINFFYLKDNFRGRIVKENSTYRVLNSEETWNEEEFKEAIVAEPWNFSPNVLLRPLYQESILPNLAYIGGPAEVAYWLQLKSSFEHYGLPFPIVIPRNFCLLVEKEVERKRQKVRLDFEQLFLDKDKLIKAYVAKYSENDLSVQKEKAEMEKFWKALGDRVKNLDPILEKTSKGFGIKTQRLLESLEKKMVRAEKRKQSDTVNQIEWLFSRLFPGGQLQERHDNHLAYLKDWPTLIDDLLQELDPLDFRFHILIQE